MAKRKENELEFIVKQLFQFAICIGFCVMMFQSKLFAYKV
mgnify:CR=1 FL=1